MSKPTKQNKHETPLESVLRLARGHGVLRPRDLVRQGIAPVYVQRLYARGQLLRVGRGLYCLPDMEVTEHHSLAEVSKRLPNGVVCLLSALRFHGLTTQAPFEVWVAIDRKARAPQSRTPPLRIVHMTRDLMTAGVEQHDVEGVKVSVFNQAKTVTDCFRFRNKIGLDVAVEALREYLRHRGKVDDLWRFAEAGRVGGIIRPYLEALA